MKEIILSQDLVAGRILSWSPRFPAPGEYALLHHPLSLSAGGTLNMMDFSPMIRLYDKNEGILQCNNGLQSTDSELVEREIILGSWFLGPVLKENI